MGAHRYTWRTFAGEMSMLIGAAIICIPTYILLTLSVKTDLERLEEPLAFPTSPHFANYGEAWDGGGGVTLGRALINSSIITIGSVVVVLALGSLSAYAIGRRPSKLSTGLYFCFLLGLVIPFQLGVIPIYIWLRTFGLLGSYGGIILLNVGLLMPLTVFLYTGFVRALPKEYEEAAEVDGAGMVRTFWRVILPLLRPVTGTVAILAGLIVWNDFFHPVIFLGGSSPNRPLPVAIYSFVGEYTSHWNIIFAAVTIALLPVVAFYFFAQRELIKGFTGGIRG